MLFWWEFGRALWKNYIKFLENRSNKSKINSLSLRVLDHRENRFLLKEERDLKLTPPLFPASSRIKCEDNRTTCDALREWYYLYNLKNVKNTHAGVLILVKLQNSACNFTKINTPPRMLFTFFKLYKWYQITQRTTYVKVKIALFWNLP